MIFLQDSTDLVTATEKLSEQRVADAAVSMVRSAELDHEPKECLGRHDADGRAELLGFRGR